MRRSASVSSAPIGRPPTSSSDSIRLRCSDPIIGRHGRCSRPTTSAASTRTSTAASPSGAAVPLTGSESSPVRSTSGSAATAYQCSWPRGTEVST